MLSQKIFLILFFSLCSLSNQFLLFSEESKLLYNKPKSYELNLKDFLKKGGDHILKSPIIISVRQLAGMGSIEQSSKYSHLSLGAKASDVSGDSVISPTIS